MSELGARSSFGHVLNDQDRRLVRVVVADTNHLKRPARVDWDCLAGLPPENVVLGSAAPPPWRGVDTIIVPS
jgi:hypothetical protein